MSSISHFVIMTQQKKCVATRYKRRIRSLRYLRSLVKEQESQKLEGDTNRVLYYTNRSRTSDGLV